MKVTIALFLCINFTAAQTAKHVNTGEDTSASVAKVYDIPFASKGNTIEISVSNTAAVAAESVRVEVTNAPAWLKMEAKQVMLPKVKSKEEQAASFSFSINKMAEVNKEQTISFTITDKNGEKLTKDIKFKVAPPANYELFQNYPNPFNPATKIEYQLPANCNVKLMVYDLLGREAASLVNERQDAGYHQSIFDASRLASGVYIYRIIASDDQNNRHVFQKKMILLR